MNTDEVMMLEKLQIRLDAICKTVMDQAAPVDPPDQSVTLQNKMQLMVVLQSKLSGKFRSNENSEPVDSDD
uniref:Uncharacterized protein n=1 Tax=Ditylenchus dipsaci TaxID=166011 RepID=A0A915DUD0_9BILA